MRRQHKHEATARNIVPLRDAASIQPVVVRGVQATARDKEDRKQRQEKSRIASNGKREAGSQEGSQATARKHFRPLLQTGMYGFERAPKRRNAEAQETVEEDPEVVAEQELKIRWST